MTHKFNKVTFPKWTLESLCKSLSISIQSEVKLLLHCITAVGIIKLINLQLVCVIELRVGGKQQNFSSWISRRHKLCFLLKGTDCCRKLQSALNCHFHWFGFVLPISLFSSESSRPGAKLDLMTSEAIQEHSKLFYCILNPRFLRFLLPSPFVWGILKWLCCSLINRNTLSDNMSDVVTLSTIWLVFLLEPKIRITTQMYTSHIKVHPPIMWCNLTRYHATIIDLSMH